MADLGTLALGTFDSTNSDTAAVGSDPLLEVIASAVDTDYVHRATNTSGTFVYYFALANMPGDFVDMTTVSINLRYLRDANNANKTWDSLSAQIFQSDRSTALTNQVTVASSITTTTATNSGATTLTGVVGSDKATWDGAVVAITIAQTKSMAGNTDSFRVTAAEVTGTYSNVSPTVEQTTFRIRPHDGPALNANGAGDWEAAADTSATMPIVERIRIRFGIKAIDGADTDGYQLRASVNAGAYALVPSETHHIGPGLTTTAQVAVVPSDSYADLAATTQLITTGTFIAGDGSEDNTVPAVTLAAGEVTEHEFCVLIRKLSDGAHLADGDTVAFRLYRDDGTALDTYTATPTITIENTPGWIGGTFPEMGQDFGPFVDGNGTLYVICERSESDNVPTVMKSTDDGVSWTEVDAANNPTTIDMEGCSAVLVDHELRIIHHPGDDNNLHYHSFRVSSHATNPDTWGTVDADIDTSVGTKVTPYSDDSCAIIYRPTSGDYVIAYTGSNGGTYSTVWIRSGVPGTWDTRFELDTEATTHFGGAHLAIDADERVHVVYKDATNGIVYHRSLDAVTAKGSDPLTSSDLSARTSMHSADETGDTIGRVDLAAYDDSGTWKVPITYINQAAGSIRMRPMVETTGAGTERTASDATVADQVADHEGAWTVPVTVDNTDIWVAWMDSAAPEKILYAKSVNGAAFDTPTTLLDASTIAPHDGVDSGNAVQEVDATHIKVITHSAKVLAYLTTWAGGGTGLYYGDVALATTYDETGRAADTWTVTESETNAQTMADSVSDSLDITTPAGFGTAETQSMADTGRAADTWSLTGSGTETQSMADTGRAADTWVLTSTGTDDIVIHYDETGRAADTMTAVDTSTDTASLAELSRFLAMVLTEDAHAETQSMADTGRAVDALVLTDSVVDVLNDSGGQTFDETGRAADGLTLTDSVTGSLTLAESGRPAENLVLTDSVVDVLDESGGQTFDETGRAADTWVLTDTATDAQAMTDTATDTLVLTEAETNTQSMAEALDDTLVLTEALVDAQSMADTGRAADPLVLTSTGTDTLIDGGQTFDETGRAADTWILTEGAHAETLTLGESRTETFAITDTGTDDQTMVESTSDSLVLTSTGTDSISGVIDETGRPADTLTLTDTGTDAQSMVEAPPDALVVTDTGTDAQSMLDTGRAADTLVLTDSGTESLTLGESVTENFILTSTGTESLTLGESRTETLVLTDTGTDDQTMVESVTDNLVLTDSGTDSVSGVFDETGLSEALVLTDTGTDDQTMDDTGRSAEALVVTESPTDAQSMVDTGRAADNLILTDSGTDSLIEGGTVYDETGRTQNLVLTDSGTDAQTFGESRTENLVLTDGGTESLTFGESVTDNLIVADSGTDTQAGSESVSDALVLTSSIADAASFIEALSDALVLVASGTENLYGDSILFGSTSGELWGRVAELMDSEWSASLARPNRKAELE